MIDKNKFFKFYNLCIPVKGLSRGVIYDLQRGSIFYVPNSLIDLLTSNSKKLLFEIFKEYKKQKKLVEKYFQYLLDNELIFLTEQPENFPNNSLQFNKPFLLDVLFMEIDLLQISKISLLKNINFLGCVKIVFISKQKLDLDILKEVIDVLILSKVQSIELITIYNSKYLKLLSKIRDKSPRFHRICFFQSIKPIKSVDKHLVFNQESIDKVLAKRITSVNDFILNQNAYIESIHHNLFFNRKAYIDNQGNIKNYFNTEKIFGNILKDDIIKIIKTKSFKRLWNINKDQIEVCNSCEFRYICPDNRIPILKNDQKDIYKHNTNCNYDPKTINWN